MVTFKRYAGSLQVQIKSFADLLEALKLPKTQWVATACPTFGLNCDAKFLTFMDTDNNGRIRVEELTNAVTWTHSMLSDHGGIDAGSDVLHLGKLSTDATAIVDAANELLEAMKVDARDTISLEQVRASEKPLRDAYFNGDGIVCPESIASERLAAVVRLLIECVPAAKNRSDKLGVTKEQIGAVRERIAKAREHTGTKESVYVWGAASESRSERIQAVKSRVNDYYRLCRIVAANPGSADRLRLPEATLVAALGDNAALEKILAASPIAPPVTDGSLLWTSLVRGPDFEAMSALRTEVFVPLHAEAPTRMTEDQWRNLVAKSDAIVAWRAVTEQDKPVFDHLDQLAAITDEEFAAVVARCEEDLARKSKLDAVEQLEKLILYQRWLLRFANNFISMPDLYDPAYVALFEQGRLTLAGRVFTFSVRVADRASHSALAARGTMYIAYVRLTSKDGGESLEVAVPVTAGTAAGIEVGKRGVFTDHHQKEWDASIVQVITNPVSLWEAIVAPYRRIGAFISSKVESWAGEGDRTLDQQLDRSYAETQAARDRAVNAAEDAASGRSASAAPASSANTTTAGAQSAGGNVAIALSIAISAISAALASIIGIFAGKTIFQIFGMLVGIFTAVSLPAAAFAWLKLRQRDMAIVLEACGWALNDRIRLGDYLGALFTRRPALPPGSTVDMFDSVQRTIERRRAEGLDVTEREGLRPKHWAMIILVSLVLLALQARGLVWGVACARKWLSPQTCQVLIAH